MNKRNAWLTLRLTAEERQRLAEAAARQRGCGLSEFARASLSRALTQMEVLEALESSEKRQAATLAAMRTEIARLHRVEHVVFAMPENLAKTILTYMPPPSAESRASAIALGRAAYDRYLKAVGMSLHNGSKAAVESLARFNG